VLASRFEYEWYGPWEKVVGKFHIRKGDKGEYRVPGWTLADEAGIGIIIRATLKGEDQPRELDLLLAQARTRNSTLGLTTLASSWRTWQSNAGRDCSARM
jgi:hypothetical protein